MSHKRFALLLLLSALLHADVRVALSFQTSTCQQPKRDSIAFVAVHGRNNNDKEGPSAVTTLLDTRRRTRTIAFNQAEEGDGVPPSEDDATMKEEAIGNLVANDEWTGIGMELTELVRTAIVEDVKRNSREFLDADEYKIGDFGKEIDRRVKDEIANLRGKEEYELGDFVSAMDEMGKQMTEEFTGKPYEVGDLTKEIDSRIKNRVAEYCGGKEGEYEFGDLSSEIDRRVKKRVGEFTGKPNYEFGDIAQEIENQRKAWVVDYLGEEAAADYEFGDITKKAVAQFTGKDDYQFGDISKKVFGDLFGNKKK